MADLHLVGNYSALFVAQRFDPGDGEVSTVQFRQRFLERGVDVILQRKSCRGRQDSGIDAVGLPVALFRDQLYLPWCGRASAFRLVVEPSARREQHEHQDEDHGYVVLPRAAFVRPEKRLRQDLSQASHVNLWARHRR